MAINDPSPQPAQSAPRRPAKVIGMNPPFDPERASTLIRAIAQSGCRASFIQLFGFYAPRVAALARRQGASVEQAKDIAQETMLSVWRHAAQFDPQRATASGWIYAIARHRQIDDFRKQPAFLTQEDPLDTISTDPTPDHDFESIERAQRIRAAIAGLPAEQSAVIRLAFLEDLTHSQIVATTGIALGTIKSRLRLALTRLRTALDEPA